MLVMTRDINNRVADDTAFAKRVTEGIARFARKDWGDVCEEDWSSNTENMQSLNDGNGGMVLASYEGTNGLDKVWIIRDAQATTVLFPSEY